MGRERIFPWCHPNQADLTSLTKKPPVIRRIKKPASLVTTWFKVIVPNSVWSCLYNGDKSGTDYSISFRPATPRSIQQRRVRQVLTFSRLSVSPCRYLLVLLNVVIVLCYHNYTHICNFVKRISRISDYSARMNSLR